MSSADPDPTTGTAGRSRFTRFVAGLGAALLVSSLAVALSPAVEAEAATSNTSTIFYSTEKNWTTYNVHYQVGSGAWTTAPGKAMTAACTGWVKADIDLGTATTWKAAFNNGSTWDNNSGSDYTLATGIQAVKGGKITTTDPCGTVIPEQPLGNELALYYSTTKNWSAYNAHYQVGTGAWTTVPGKAMTAACTGWVTTTIPTTGATSVTAAFTNGTGTWDNNGSKNYTFTTPTAAVNNGTITTTNPCPDKPTEPTAPAVPTGLKAVAAGKDLAITWNASTGATKYVVVIAAAGQPTKTVTVTSASLTTTDLVANTAYKIKVRAANAAGKSSAYTAVVTASTGSTTAPTIPAAPTGLSATPAGKDLKITWNASAGATKYSVVLAATGQTTKTVSVTSASLTTTDLVANTAYKIKVRASNTAGSSGYTPTITVTTGGGTTTPTAPAVPTELKAVPDITSIAVTWKASANATKYTVSYTTGSTTKTLESTTASATISGLTASTAYAIKVSATGTGGTSAYTSPVSTTTLPKEEEPVTTTGSPLGGDPREDSIYFIMTARWNDGDSSNNRGGSQHIKSGNAANNDPAFRGDFKGVIDKLDYIKGLGFSAVWITPVVLNRSDYDFHGYHGWDFFRVDPRLESQGATYQELIDAAHSKGIKIYQDVVYNHSSRWGAKGLFTPTVYGTRDAQWDWMYSEKVAGKQYNPLEENELGRAYNGDVWSSTQPAGQDCKNFGTPTGGFSPEGYKLYNCQWPNGKREVEELGLWPAKYYHQCYNKGWEDITAINCWIHDDLADFNTESKDVQKYLIDAYNRYIDMGVDGFRIDTAVHIPRVTWNRVFLPAIQEHAVATHGEKGKDFYVFGEVAQFVHDKWNRGSVAHSAPFYTWKERKEYSLDDVVAAAEAYTYENNTMGTANQPSSDNARLRGNTYHAPDHSKFSGMNIIDMRMHMNFSEAGNAFGAGMDSDDITNDATFNTVYVDSHDYGPNKSSERFAGGTDAWAENMSLMWTFRGIPTLFYGSEIEFQKGVKIDCGASCPLATTGRAYFGDQIQGTVVASDFGKVQSATGAVAATFEKPLVKHLQTLNQIRRAVPALQKGQYSTEGVSGGMAFKKRFTEGSVDSFVVVAISGSASFSGIPNGTYTDAVTGDVKTVTNGSLSISANGKGNMRAYVLSLPGNPAPGKVGNGSPYLK
ncbi:alpha-amylase family glycosyl hydrolase [Agromyces atrinae]|uniref:carbohydrate binding domain-containing protein n=1 Tax=Agromyces atrinae TaxID=592376 RepID=UPI001F56BBC2|nr:carbohydrate binding domain-containing protein [Agromyces atrinae]MCI2957287.1 alpha-amylase family glycosyl hydrolase [Agromyces atrinae]